MGHDIANEVVAVRAQATVTKTSTYTGSAVDLGRNIESALAILEYVSLDYGSSNETYVFSITHSDSSTGSFSTVGTFSGIDPSSATTGMAQMALNPSGGLKRYVKVVATLGGTTPSATYSCQVVVKRRGIRPVTS